MTNDRAAISSRPALKHILAAGTIIASLFAASPVFAQGTVAGTLIDNKATASYDTPQGETTIESNTVSLRVDELLNVTVASADSGDVSATPAVTNRVLRYTVTNSGNGSEAFSLAADGNVGGDDFNPTITSIVLDTNDNGVYDAGVDTVYVPGSNDPVLAPDATIRVFVLATIPGSATDGQRGIVDLTATTLTGSGTPGTTFAGQGQGGGNAVVGATTATATDDGRFVISQATAALVKSASVIDPFGGATQVPGSIITYSIAATVSGSGSLTNLRVGDVIPDGTTYQTNSITLDGVALTDAADADAGRFSAGAIAVSLGNVSAGTTRTVAFRVTID
ncbi:hypothetical protein [Allosphingosinicella vermicomposti]|uniref:hypothetical protein n=1 Tax=Allosphingosinicella vermicomposti TaxID=614671 RepID=UPI000D0F3DE3|nr:hypothetical protein [Allosphingosinicella vermicomposti]